MIEFRGSEHLSAEAQKLVELTMDGGDGRFHGAQFHENVDLATILQQHPELMGGLNEYTKWRDTAMTAIDKKDAVVPVGHGISEALKALNAPQKVVFHRFFVWRASSPT